MKKGSHHSPETLMKMKEIRCNIEYLSNQRETHLGSKNVFYGKHHSPEIKERIRLSKLGRPRSPETIEKIRLAQRKHIQEKNSNWRGGEINNNGYVYVASPGHPFCHSSNYILKSHLVIEKITGTILPLGIAVHHINGKKCDDRPQNLMAFISSGDHIRFHSKHACNPNKIIFDGRKYQAR